jgi:hypothetical protein
MRKSANHYEGKTRKLINGYDYDNQCWVRDGKIQSCGHPDAMPCGCYGRAHAGEDTTATAAEEIRRNVASDDFDMLNCVL